MRLTLTILLLVGICNVAVPVFSSEALGQSRVISRVGRTLELESPDGKLIANGKEKEIEIIEKASKKRLAFIKLDSELLFESGVAWNPASTKLIVGTKTGLHVYEVKTAREVQTFKLFPPNLACSWSPNGKFIASTGTVDKSVNWPNCLKVWDQENGKEILSLDGTFWKRIFWSKDSRSFATIDKDPTVQIIDLTTAKVRSRIKYRPGPTPDIAWSPDNRHIAIGNVAGHIEIYDTISGAFINEHYTEDISGINWMRDGKHIKIKHEGDGKDISKWKVPIDSKTGQLIKTKRKILKVGMKGYIPKDLEECFKQLDAELPPKTVKEISSCREDDMFNYHFGLGTWLRNYWGLWAGSDLAKYFNKMDIHHPDDMSGIILRSYWSHKHSKPLELDKQISRYQNYWASMKAAREKENTRVAESKELIRDRMMNLKVAAADCPTVDLEQRSFRGIDVRYAAPFEGKIFIVGKTIPQIVSLIPFGRFSSNCYLIDLNTKEIKSIWLKSLPDLEGGIVWRNKLYLLGKRGEDAIVAEVGNGKVTEIKLPKSESWNILGYGADKLLLVQPHIVYELTEDRTWSKLFASEVSMPKCARPPVLGNERLYFRDEGEHGDNKSLSWIKPKNPKFLVAFAKDTRLVGSSGPRWENVYSFQPVAGDCLWLTAGSSSPSVLKWTKDAGYRIAIMNTKLEFDGKLIGNSYLSDPPTTSFSVTCVNPISAEHVLCAGPSGMFKIDQQTITPVVRFKNTTQSVKESFGDLHWNWRPNYLIRLGDQKYFISGHWGGCYLLEKGGDSQWKLNALDDKLKGIIEY